MNPFKIVFVLFGLIALAGCDRSDPLDNPVETDAATAVAPSDAVAAAPVVLDADGLKRVCKAGLAAIHGQQPGDIAIDGLEGQVANASWRAPVDGGRMRAQCKVEGDLIAWKPVDRPVAEQNRWMTQSGDPEVRFVMDGAKITITQTLPDGAKEQSELTVPIEEEAA